MKEEVNIRKKVGTENPFRVPDGYFESLTEQVMNSLPRKEMPVAAPQAPVAKPSARVLKFRPWIYAAAAMLAGAVMLLRFPSSNPIPAAPSTPIVDVLAIEEAEIEMEYINMAVDNSMLEDYELYVYLADSDMESW